MNNEDIEIAAMEAENQARLQQGLSPAYGEDAFRKLKHPSNLNGIIIQYNKGEISFEKLAELLGVNYYTLTAMCFKRIHPTTYCQISEGGK